MFERPDEITDDDVARVVIASWGLDLEQIEHAPVGFGSHHWRVRGSAGEWFVTVDDFDARLIDVDDDRRAARHRLVAALRTARALADVGCRWVVAPEPSMTATVLEPLGDRFGVSVFPQIPGVVSASGEYADDDERRAVVGCLAELHAVGVGETFPTMVDDLTIPLRDRLAVAIDATGEWSGGPYAERAQALLATHRSPLLQVLAAYDELVEARRLEQPQLVITHGEPHRANVIMTDSGPCLIDWETALLSTPERDLWSLVAADPSIRDHYEATTGTAVDDRWLRLHSLWWDLCEVSLYIDDFRRPHAVDHDTATGWDGLVEHLDPSRWVDVTG